MNDRLLTDEELYWLVRKLGHSKTAVEIAKIGQDTKTAEKVRAEERQNLMAIMKEASDLRVLERRLAEHLGEVANAQPNVD